MCRVVDEMGRAQARTIPQLLPAGANNTTSLSIPKHALMEIGDNIGLG
jgi:hypothetical protein